MKSKRAGNSDEETADDILRVCHESRWSLEFGVDRQNTWQKKQRKAEEETRGCDEGDDRGRSDNAAALNMARNCERWRSMSVSVFNGPW